MRSVIKTILGIAVVLGLLVGFAHWQLSSQSPDGEWEVSLGRVAGTPHVGGNTVLVQDTFGEGWLAVDLRTGRHLADEGPTTTYEVRLGNNGWFAVRSGSSREHTFTLYDESGQTLWDRTMTTFNDGVRVVSMSDDGAVLIATTHLGDQKWKHELLKVDGEGTVLWQRPMVDGEGGGPTYRQARSDDVEAAENVAVPSAPVIRTAQGYRFLDDDGRVTGPAAPEKYTVAIDDMLVSTSLKDGNCTFHAQRIDGEVWRSDVPCPQDTRSPYPLTAIGNLLLVSTTEGPVAINTDNGDAEAAPYNSPHGFNPKTLEAVAISDRVAVEQHKSSFTGWNPLTGKKLWTFDGPAPTKGLTSGKTDRYPGVDVSGDAVSILSSSKPWWRLFAWGKDVPSSAATILDAETGEKEATFRSARLYALTTTDDGDLLLISDGVLRRIAR